MRVPVVEIATGKQLRGEDAPFAIQLGAWLESHPGWEMMDDSEDESGNEDDDLDEDNLSRDAEPGKESRGNDRLRCAYNYELTFKVSFGIFMRVQIR